MADGVFIKGQPLPDVIAYFLPQIVNLFSVYGGSRIIFRLDPIWGGTSSEWAC